MLHLHNEQPLLADLPAEPAPGDVSVICTNLRTVDGKRPFFVDSSSSLFVFPLTQMRFVEIPTAVPATPGPPALPPDVAEGRSPVATAESGPAGGDSDELELDEELLRRVREL